MSHQGCKNKQRGTTHRKLRVCQQEIQAGRPHRTGSHGLITDFFFNLKKLAVIHYFLCRRSLPQELFVRLVPYHCLGSLWSQRDKKGREGVCWSVRATVRQFNKLANAVLASCLSPTKLRSQQRARLLEKWISVAEVSM